MDYYLYNPGGSDRGPFTREQLHAKLASGACDPKTRVRSDAGTDYRPLSEVVDVPPPAIDAHVVSPIRPFRSTSLSGWFMALAILDFIAAGIGLLMVAMVSGGEAATGLTLFAVGLSGAFVSLAVAKILIICQKSYFAFAILRSLPRPRPNHAMQPTTGRREDKFPMTQPLLLQPTRALASGG